MKMRLRRLLVLFAAGFFVAFAVPSIEVLAQTNATNQATVQGNLTDPSGARISGAVITADPLDPAGKPAETRSGAEGKYSLALSPGRYRVTIRSASFRRVEQEFSVAAGETRKWNVRLELELLSSQVVVTASTEPTTLETTAASTDVITKQDIDERQQMFLTPLLASLPGASFSQLGPMGGTTTFFLDGGNSNYTKVLIDGVPVNQPGGLVDFSNFTLDSIDKIEVVHGASSALYGSDAMDGVIQIFTHRGSTRTPQLSLEGDGGTFDTGHGAGQLSGLLGAFDYSLGTGYFSSQGQGPGNFFRDTTLSGNFGWKFSDTDSLRLTLRNNSSDAGQPGQTLLPGGATPGESSNIHEFAANLAWNFSTGEHWQHQVSAFESRFQLVDVAPPFGTFTSKYNRAGGTEQSSYLFKNGSFTAGYENEVE